MPDPQALCQRVLAARRSLAAGVVTFRACDFPQGERREMLLCRTLFDNRTAPRSIRSEYALRDLQGQTPAAPLSLEDGTLHPISRLMLAGEESICFFYAEGSPGDPRSGISIFARPANDRLEVNRHPIDPLPIGMMPHSFNMYFTARFEDAEEFLTISNATIEPAERELGPRVWKVSWSTIPGQTRSVWIDEDRGPSIVRAETHGGISGAELVGVMQVELAPVTGGWYPKSVTYKSRRDSKQGLNELILVDEARFNLPIEASEFTIAGLRPHAGAHVDDAMGRWDPASIWDGNKIVEPSAPTLTPRRWNSMFVVANLLAIGAGVFLFLYFREQRAGSS